MLSGITHASRQWWGVGICFLGDVIIVWLSLLVGLWGRFGAIPGDKILAYGPGFFAASLVLPSLCYIGGGYRTRAPGPEGLLSHFRCVFVALGGVLLVMLAMGSVDFSARIGRGVLAISFGSIVVLTFLHHVFIDVMRTRRWKLVLCLVSAKEDEAAVELLHELWSGRAREMGIITSNHYRPRSGLKQYASLSDWNSVTGLPDVDLILVRDRHLSASAYGPLLRQLRYKGVEIVSLADACEEAYQAVPMGLVTESWLFRASHQSGIFYVKKFKRLFDIVASILFMLLLLPVFLLGCLAVKLSSRGPVFFRQIRSGRFGRPFTVFKLRTMDVDAEEKGAQWSGDGDPRVYPAGRWMRKFRIDEIPQLLNVLRGEMSFVGPRPERPEFIDELAEQIPWYRERLMVQPGLTGWAQVKYPYGASVEDASNKLEYDLYYMKHMSVLLDCCILLETVKVILGGGVRGGGDLTYLNFRRKLEAMAADTRERSGLVTATAVGVREAG